MKSGRDYFTNTEKRMRNSVPAASAQRRGEVEPARERETRNAVRAMNLPEGVWASVAMKPGEYDARRLRSQREVIRDVMLAAGDCGTWLTLSELRALTHYGEASISAQLRHLRRTDNGGYDVAKRRREGASVARPAADGRGDYVWEYRVAPVNRAGTCSMTAAAIEACRS